MSVCLSLEADQWSTSFGGVNALAGGPPIHRASMGFASRTSTDVHTGSLHDGREPWPRAAMIYASYAATSVTSLH